MITRIKINTFGQLKSCGLMYKICLLTCASKMTFSNLERLFFAYYRLSFVNKNVILIYTIRKLKNHVVTEFLQIWSPILNYFIISNNRQFKKIKRIIVTSWRNINKPEITGIIICTFWLQGTNKILTYDGSCRIWYFQ